MARALSSREKRLLAILGLLAIPVLWTLLRDDASERRPEGRRGREDDKVALVDPPRVRLDVLERRADAIDENDRDLFKYSQRPPSARELARLRAEAEAQRRAEEAARLAAEEAARRAAEENARRAAELAANPPPPPPPQPPSMAFKYIGYLGPKNARIAVFEEAGDLMLAKIGETVREQFKVVDIKYDSVVMGYKKKEFEGMTKELPMARK